MRIWLSGVRGTRSVVWPESVGSRLPFVMLVILTSIGLPAVAQDAVPAEAPAVAVPGDLSLEQMFADYLHFAKMGRFREADAYATALLAREDCQPEAMLALAEKYRNSRETLIQIIAGTDIRDSAEKVLAVIREGEVLKRKSAEQITGAIELLAGDPTQRLVGLNRLQHAGEYAVPWMVAALADATKKEMQPYIRRALPKVGRLAVNPLVVALRIPQDAVRETLLDVLAELGYPQALPYAKQIAEDAAQPDSVRETARRAVTQILARDPSLGDRPAAGAFLDLAEQYFVGTASLEADPREDLANVWYLREGQLIAIPVPREIFDEVQCMRACQDALAIQSELPDAVALWLAANFRREAQLGMDVRSVEPDERAANDKTRPDEYPRSIYFARCLGPRYAHLTLTRAVKDRDAAVALGAVTALDGIASASELVGPEDVKQALTLALSFPDVLVRIKAALALARALPPQDFPGARQVVPILASALDLRAATNVLIVDPNDESRQLLADWAKRANAQVVASANFVDAVAQAHRDLTKVDLILLASDMEAPDADDALKKIHKDDKLELSPVVLVVKPTGAPVRLKIEAMDKRVGRVHLQKWAGLSDDEVTELGQALTAAWNRAGDAYGHRTIDENEALQLSLVAADALRLIATTGTSVFEFGAAEDALVRACGHPTEEMRIAAAAVLAWSSSPAAQGAIARLALDPEGSDAQRIAVFGILAESAKRVGRQMVDDLVEALTTATLEEPKLTIRTAASQALGAMNLAGGRAAEIIRSYTAE
ncbi:MAG: hypothetical protein JXA69_15600 [Phycisphaerae bacterium]|nr:hypothetical protein [Phycisphaerae bacterium]